MELTTGPHGETNGSYQFSGNPNSFIEFPNDGGLDTLHSITLMCWVQPGGRDGPLFNYKNSGAWGVHIWIVNGKFFNRITKYPNHAFFDAIRHFQWDSGPMLRQLMITSLESTLCTSMAICLKQNTSAKLTGYQRTTGKFDGRLQILKWQNSSDESFWRCSRWSRH